MDGVLEKIKLELLSPPKNLKGFYQQLKIKLGDTHTLQIVDIDIEEGGTNSVFVELATHDMVNQFKSLDGVTCLGEPISVRKQGEETTQTSAQAAVIALKALGMITGQKQGEAETGEQAAEEEI